MNNDFVISPIGKINSPLSQKFGTPRQPNLVGVEAVVELQAPFNNPLAVAGLEDFSHIWLIWQFSNVPAEAGFRAQVRPPRLGGSQKKGVFASRSPFRPNRLGLSVVALKEVCVENGKVNLVVVGADLVDGTPIFDIKPYIAYSDSLPHALSGFAPEPPKPKPVVWSKAAEEVFKKCVSQGILEMMDKSTITKLVALDPRPAFDAERQGRHYKMRYKSVDVVFCWRGSGFEIEGVA